MSSAKSISPAKSNPQWVPISVMAETLAISHERARHLVRVGAIVTRRLPGSRPTVSAADLQRLANESVKPATVGVGA